MKPCRRVNRSNPVKPLPEAHRSQLPIVAVPDMSDGKSYEGYLAERKRQEQRMLETTFSREAVAAVAKANREPADFSVTLGNYAARLEAADYAVASVDCGSFTVGEDPDPTPPQIIDCGRFENFVLGDEEIEEHA